MNAVENQTDSFTGLISKLSGRWINAFEMEFGMWLWYVVALVHALMTMLESCDNDMGGWYVCTYVYLRNVEMSSCQNRYYIVYSLHR